MNSPNKKYRPYFTLAELQTIKHSLITSSPSNLPLIRYLDSYITDIERGNRSPNHTNLPSLEQKLGLSIETENPIRETPARCYEMWANNVPISPAQLQAANQYRYENNLMTPDEESAWEIRNGVKF
jgi:hypothetical protein